MRMLVTTKIQQLSQQWSLKQRVKSSLLVWQMNSILLKDQVACTMESNPILKSVVFEPKKVQNIKINKNKNIIIRITKIYFRGI